MNSVPELPRVLCVDDERHLLEALARALGDDFDVTTASSGRDGLARISQSGPFDVIVSDMRMPGMDGAAFLSLARSVAPEAVRILLTGHADTEAAMAAVNRGAIFRFLAKPCPEAVLRQALNDAVEYHHVARAEHELLETTLSASIRVLSDVLAMVFPAGHRRAIAARHYVAHALRHLGWPEAWLYEVAAALSQLGCIGVPADVLRRAEAGEELTAAERLLMADHPQTAHALIVTIPRLERVAAMVRHQATAVREDEPEEVHRGARLLQAALMYEQFTRRGMSDREGRQALNHCMPPIPPEIIEAVCEYRALPVTVRAAQADELEPGWIADEDIVTGDDTVIVPRGQELTATAILIVRRLVAAGSIAEPLYVRA